jgi:BolA family transcriptional regulator, general stress-responsive regulator
MVQLCCLRVKASTVFEGRDIMELGPIGKTLESKLRAAFQPTSLDVIDESHHHAGHSGSHPMGESHFRVKIKAEAFRGLSRVAQHRLVNGVLAAEVGLRVHALALETGTP